MLQGDRRKNGQIANFSILLPASLVHSQNTNKKENSRLGKQPLVPTKGAYLPTGSRFGSFEILEAQWKSTFQTLTLIPKE